jgi:hypothetical protein
VCWDYFFKTERDIDKLVPKTAMNRVAEQIILLSVKNIGGRKLFSYQEIYIRGRIPPAIRKKGGETAPTVFH